MAVYFFSQEGFLGVESDRKTSFIMNKFLLSVTARLSSISMFCYTSLYSFSSTDEKKIPNIFPPYFGYNSSVIWGSWDTELRLTPIHKSLVWIDLTSVWSRWFTRYKRRWGRWCHAPIVSTQDTDDSIYFFRRRSIAVVIIGIATPSVMNKDTVNVRTKFEGHEWFSGLGIVKYH